MKMCSLLRNLTRITAKSILLISLFSVLALASKAQEVVKIAPIKKDTIGDFSVDTLIVPMIPAQPMPFDTIIMRNGDQLVGEIKKMEKAVLFFETPYSDKDLNIEWVKVERIYSSNTFIISIQDGERLKAQIRTNPDDVDQVIIRGEDVTFKTSVADIIMINELGDGFISRLKASVAVGYTDTKANGLRQFTTRSSLGYYVSKWSSDGYLNVVNSKQDGVADTKRTDANLRALIYLKREFYYTAIGSFLQNDEQKLKLRSNYRTGIGKFIVYTNHVYWGLTLGAAYNNDTFTEEGQANLNSLEAYGSMDVNFFDFGDLSLSLQVVAYPGITEKGRIRTDVTTDLKYDLPLDFFIKFGLTHNYDNQPVEGGAKIDYVLQASFGWEL